jgi:thiol-disulfide isomerase/thioredoxin
MNELTKFPEPARAMLVPANELSTRSLGRRTVIGGAASLIVPAWVHAQQAAKPKAKANAAQKPMTAAAEAAAAKAIAESNAFQLGESMHPAVGTSPRLKAAVTLLDGRSFTENDAKGKMLMVFYWASWCPVCKVVGPRLHSFWQKNQAKGIEVLALSTDTEVQPAFSYVQRAGYKYPVSMAAAARLDESMAPRSLPTLMIRSKLGVIIVVEEGDIEDDEFNDYLVHL